MREHPGIDGESDIGASLVKNTILNKNSGVGSMKQSSKSLMI